MPINQMSVDPTSTNKMSVSQTVSDKKTWSHRKNGENFEYQVQKNNSSKFNLLSKF
jgi:hypothetical protein